MIRISVIVPCYNQAQYLDECLQSVFDQTYENWECVVVNDGSPDNTEEVVKKWLEKSTRFKYIFKENGKMSSARNAGIKIATGEWILPLDADDKISPKYMELAEKEFDKGYSVIYCEAEYFGVKKGRWNLREATLKNLAIHNLFFCSAFFKKIDWERVGGYDEKMIYGNEDYEFWIAILKDKETNNWGFKIPEVCFYYRVKVDSTYVRLITIKEREKEMNDYLSFKHAQFFIQQLGNFHQLYPSFISYNRILNNVYFKPLISILRFFRKLF